MINTLPIAVSVGAVSSVAAVILLYIFVLPEKKRLKMPAWIQRIIGILEFKELFLEKALRFLYVLSTVACFITGAFMFFGFSHYSGRYTSHTQWYGGYGILLMIVGPIVLRLIFEGIMMFILLVKNTIEINNKMKETPDKDENK